MLGYSLQTIHLSLIIISLFYLALRLSVPTPVFLLLGLTPIIIIYLFSSDSFRVFQYEGPIHIALTHKIMGGNIPPFNPFLAHEKVIYYWGYHLFVAIFSKLLFLTPPNSIMAINIISCGIVFYCVYKISQIILKDRIANILSGAASVYLVAPFPPDFLLRTIYPLTSGFIVLDRGANWVNKFIAPSGMPLGVALFVFIVYLILRFYQPSINKRVFMLLFSLAYFSLGYIYPFFIPPMAIFLMACSIHGLTHVLDREKTFWCLIIPGAIISCFLAYYLFTIIQFQPRSYGFRLWRLPLDMLQSIGQILVFFIPLLILGFWKRQQWQMLYSLKKNTVRILFICLVSIILSFVVIRLIENYKYMQLFHAFLGVFTGIVFSFYFRQNPKISFLIFLIFLFPATESLRGRYKSLQFRGWKTDVSWTKMLPGEEWKNDMCFWIQSNSDIDDVFVDGAYLIPVFTGRSVLVGMTPHFRNTKGGLYGHDRSLVSRRYNLTKTILSGEFTEKTLIALNSEIKSPTAQIFIVSQRVELTKNLEKRNNLSLVYNQNNNAIFKLNRSAYFSEAASNRS